ncbi:MAG: hypothetical protein R6W90_00030 [Ignavibacteriaceae bacterium]
MNLLKIENWFKDYSIVIFMAGIAFGWLIMWFLYMTFAWLVL